jgi:hypothetical protein
MLLRNLVVSFGRIDSLFGTNNWRQSLGLTSSVPGIDGGVTVLNGNRVATISYLNKGEENIYTHGRNIMICHTPINVPTAGA